VSDVTQQVEFGLIWERAQTAPAVDQDGDLELDTLPNWLPVQLSENWRDGVASLSARHQPSSSIRIDWKRLSGATGYY